MRSLLYIIFCFSSLSFFAQKSKVIFQSNTKHNYALGHDYYVENNIDTTKLLFMGVIEISTNNTDEDIAQAQALLKIKAKDLNANSYKLKNFIIQSSSIVMLFDVYFAPEKQINLMKTNSYRDKIFLFNNYKDTINRFVWINGLKSGFPRNKRIEISAHNREINIVLDDTTSGVANSRTFSLTQNKLAYFYTIKLKDNVAPVVVGALVGGMVGALVASTVVEKRKNKVENEAFSKLNYNTGRILTEIYSLEKQISIP